MNLSEVEELMEKFDRSTIREFFWNNGTDELSFSKNEQQFFSSNTDAAVPAQNKDERRSQVELAAPEEVVAAPVAEGEIVCSPLVGVIYRKPAPDKAEFVNVGDHVKKGQTLLIIEAMKVMNEVIAPKDGLVTEILVSTDDVVEYGQELVRIK